MFKVWLLSLYHDLLAKKELFYYRNKAKRNRIKILNGADLSDAVRARLLCGKTAPAPKKKGSLHVFLMCSMNNWENVLPLALSSFGKVTVFSWKSGGFFDRHKDWADWRSDLNKNMLEAFHKANTEQQVDVLVGYLSDFNTKSETLKEIGSRGAVILNMCWDDKLRFSGKIKDQPCSIENIVPWVDLSLTNAPDSCLKYFAAGGRAVFWPEAALPQVHRPYDMPFEFDVSFVGQCYGWRPYFIRKLAQSGIKVECFGNGWERGALTAQEMVKLYSRSRINLGFSSVGYSRKLTCLKGRDFEVPMSGGLYLTQSNPELALVYEEGKEIMTYKDEADCVKKIRWLLDHPDEAQKIRQAGQRRAMADHTWEKRFGDVFKLTGILVNGG